MENTAPQVNGEINISQTNHVPTTPPPVNQTPKKKVNVKIILIVVVVFLFLTGGASAFYLLNNKTPELTACTLEAKICPDGSSVGRTGPNCEFAPCPTISEENQPPATSDSKPTLTPNATADWKTLTNTSYKYSIKTPSTMSVIPVGINLPGGHLSPESAPDIIACSNCTETNYMSFPNFYIRTIELKYTVNKDKSLEQIAKENFQANIDNKNNTFSVVDTIKQTSVDGMPAYTYTLNSSGYSGKNNGFTTHSGINKIVETMHNGIYYIIIYSSGDTFDEILSTFKFTN